MLAGICASLTAKERREGKHSLWINCLNLNAAVLAANPYITVFMWLHSRDAWHVQRRRADFCIFFKRIYLISFVLIKTPVSDNRDMFFFLADQLEMTDRNRGCLGKAPHPSSLCQGDGGMKLSFSFAPPLALLFCSQLIPSQSAMVLSGPCVPIFRWFVIYMYVNPALHCCLWTIISQFSYS